MGPATGAFLICVEYGHSGVPVAWRASANVLNIVNWPTTEFELSSWTADDLICDWAVVELWLGLKPPPKLEAGWLKPDPNPWPLRPAFSLFWPKLG